MKKRAKSKRGYLFIENVLEPARVDSPSFAKVYPEAARQWLYEKNCGFGPDDFSFGSTVRAWLNAHRLKTIYFKLN